MISAASDDVSVRVVFPQPQPFNRAVQRCGKMLSRSEPWNPEEYPDPTSAF